MVYFQFLFSQNIKLCLLKCFDHFWCNCSIVKTIFCFLCVFYWIVLDGLWLFLLFLSTQLQYIRAHPDPTCLPVMQCICLTHKHVHLDISVWSCWMSCSNTYWCLQNIRYFQPQLFILEIVKCKYIWFWLFWGVVSEKMNFPICCFCQIQLFTIMP